MRHIIKSFRKKNPEQAQFSRARSTSHACSGAQTMPHFTSHLSVMLSKKRFQAEYEVYEKMQNWLSISVIIFSSLFKTKTLIISGEFCPKYISRRELIPSLETKYPDGLNFRTVLATAHCAPACTQLLRTRTQHQQTSKTTYQLCLQIPPVQDIWGIIKQKVYHRLGGGGGSNE